MRHGDTPTNEPAPDIDGSLVRELIAEQFPAWADLPIRPVETGGWDNRTFRLGEDMSVRLPSAERYAAQVQKEQTWLPKIARHVVWPIPVPLAMGAPGRGYPWYWSICRWLEGEPATIDRIADLNEFAADLARFLAALQQIDPAGGPPPGRHNFFRGGSLATYDAETRAAIASLGDRVDARAALSVWEAAIESTWHEPPVWIHGDVEASNLLVQDGRLSAVIDFGCCGVGDPACDLAIAWTLFAGSGRETFRAALPLDRATWMRGRGWALWKSLMQLAEHSDTNSPNALRARRTLDAVLADHDASSRR